MATFPQFQPQSRAEWRAWLKKHHTKSPGVWLVYAKKHTTIPSLTYNDAVEEALCFGWIDSTQKGIDEQRVAQRFTPRRRVGGLSEMNRQRVRRLAAEGKMTPAGMAVIGDALEESPVVVAPDVERALRRDPAAWEHFQGFPEGYRRLRIAYIEGARDRPEEFAKRLEHFVRRTAKNQRFGYVKEFR